MQSWALLSDACSVALWQERLSPAKACLLLSIMAQLHAASAPAGPGRGRGGSGHDGSTATAPTTPAAAASTPHSSPLFQQHLALLVEDRWGCGVGVFVCGGGGALVEGWRAQLGLGGC